LKILMNAAVGAVLSVFSQKNGLGPLGVKQVAKFNNFWDYVVLNQIHGLSSPKPFLVAKCFHHMVMK